MASFRGVSFLYFFNLRPIYRFLVLKGVFFIFGGPKSKTFFSKECSPWPKDSENIRHLGSVVNGFRDMASDIQIENSNYCHH